jgi:hypothetical protein
MAAFPAPDPAATGSTGGNSVDRTKFTVAPEAIARAAAEQSEKDWVTALEVTKLAVQSYAGQQPSDTDIQRRCEALWQWMKVDEWNAP